MKRIPVVLLLLFLITAGLSGFSRADGDRVKIGVLAKRGPERCLEKWSSTAAYLTERIPGRQFAIIPLDHNQLYSSVQNREIDFILANPAYYVPFEKLHGAKRIATLKNLVVGEVTQFYGGVVFTRADRTDIRHFEDLEDKSFMAVDKSSFGGWIAFRRELNTRNIDYRRFFSQFQFGETGTHDEVVHAVRNGHVDAGTVRTDTLERMQAEGKIRMSDFFIVKIHKNEAEHFPFVCSTRVYPEWPFADAGTIPDKLAEQVALVLLQMPSDSPAAIAAASAGWTIPANYQSVHECLKELKLDPYRELGKITLKAVLKKYWYGILLTTVLFVMMGVFLIVIYNLNRNLQLSHDKLNHSYVKLKAEIEERKLTEKKLIQAKKDAETATRAKSDFLANMSHEIRTPMNGVIASVELILRENLPPRVKHYLKIIHSSAYSLLGIINDILDFSKIEADKLELERHPFRLDDILDRVVDLFINKAVEKRIELLFDIDVNTPRAFIGDSLRLQQILINLVSNAVKFTEKGGVIIVGVKGEAVAGNRTELTFYVKDSGIGIAPDFMPNLFKPFTQQDSSSTRKYSGAGLGLSICKQLVDMMNGNIRVESRQKEGSTFYFTIEMETRAELKKEARIAPSEFRNMNIMVVDDSRESLFVMRNMLKAFGFNVQSADSGKQALEILKTRGDQIPPFHLIIVDYYMPEIDGIETSRQIRQQLKLSVPIILMTTFGRESAGTKAEHLGIDDFVTKPLYPSTLFDVMMNVFRKSVPDLSETQWQSIDEVSIDKEILEETQAPPIQKKQAAREIGMTATTEPSGLESGIDFDRIVPLFKGLADAIDTADPEAIDQRMNAVKEHLSDSLLMDLEVQLHDYEYEEALQSLKEIARHLGFCLIPVQKPGMECIKKNVAKMDPAREHKDESREQQ